MEKPMLLIVLVIATIALTDAVPWYKPIQSRRNTEPVESTDDDGVYAAEKVTANLDGDAEVQRPLNGGGLATGGSRGYNGGGLYQVPDDIQDGYGGGRRTYNGRKTNIGGGGGGSDRAYENGDNDSKNGEATSAENNSDEHLSIGPYPGSRGNRFQSPYHGRYRGDSQNEGYYGGRRFRGGRRYKSYVDDYSFDDGFYTNRRYQSFRGYGNRWESNENGGRFQDYDDESHDRNSNYDKVWGYSYGTRRDKSQKDVDKDTESNNGRDSINVSDGDLDGNKQQNVNKDGGDDRNYKDNKNDDDDGRNKNQGRDHSGSRRRLCNNCEGFGGFGTLNIGNGRGNTNKVYLGN